MKKLLIALIFLLAVGTVCIYVFIPKKITVSHTVDVKVNDRWAFQYLSNKNEWKKWWPGTISDTSLVYNGQVFTIDSLYYNSLTVNVTHNGSSTHTKIIIIPSQVTEVHIGWVTEINGDLNPLSRLKQYQNAVLLKQSINTILDKYSKWLEIPENIYGFKVIPSKIVDTVLITKMVQFRNQYPTPFQIDSLLKILRNHISKFDASEDGYPMMHVINNHPGLYDAQVAIPINKEIPETKDLKIKRMFPGNVLVTRFKGGPYTISKAYEACDNYKNDNQRVFAAIPFQSMITDRVKEPDTTKWETIVNFPVQ